MNVLERIKRGELLLTLLPKRAEDILKIDVEEAEAELLRLAKLGAEVEKGLKIIHSGLEGIRDYQFKHPHLVVDRLLKLTQQPLPEPPKEGHNET